MSKWGLIQKNVRCAIQGLSIVTTDVKMMFMKIIRSTTVPSSLVSFCTGQLKELSKKYEVVAVSSPGEALEQIHKSDGVRVIAVPMERHISIFKDLKSLWQMYRVFRKEKPYLVHSMTPKAGLICMMASWMARVPRRVHTFTGLIWPTSTGLKRRILMLTDMIVCGCATHVIPEGQGVMNDLHNHITKKPMKVLGNGNVRGIDLDFWKMTDDLKKHFENLKESYGLANCFTFVFVGRIVGDKGINELVEAFSRLIKGHENVRLMLVGDYEAELDPLSENTQTIIDATSQILYVGPQYGEDLKAHYAASDCFVFPSYREGFPNTPIEAGAMGLPSIVTDINGSREIIENEKNGLIIPSKDANALYNAMKRMVEDEPMRQRMASVSRSMIASRFEQSFVRKCLYDFYDEIM